MRLIRGAPGSGKTALVFREFTEAVKSGEPDLRIVVPTATLVRHYQHELAREGLVFDPGMVVSLSRYALECAPDLTLVPESLVRALVRAALRRLALPEFVQVAETRGMAEIVRETIALFENADCTPQGLAGTRGLSAHGKAFHRIWKDVDAAITARGFATRGQLLRRAASAAAIKDGDSRIWMDGFLRFSPLERVFVRALAKHSGLTLTLIDGPLTDDTQRFATECGATHYLLSGATTRHPDVVAVQTSSPEREADEIARRILELYNAGTDFPSIAVALRDVDGWLPLLRTTFDRFGIPARYYFSTPAAGHPVSLFLSGLLSSALRNWEFAPTLKALRAHPAWGLTAEFDRFDFRVREAMPGRGAGELLAFCESEHFRSSIADCLKVASWNTEFARPGVWRRRFTQLAESLYRVRTIPAPADYAAIETARSHAAALQAWAAAIDTASHVWTADTPISLDQFHSEVVAALDTAGMRIPDHRGNVVHVMSVFEARQWEVRALFVCGMTARDYPRRNIQNLLFPDSDIAKLRPAIPLRTIAEADQDEELLFDSLITRASDALILTVSSHNAAGQSLLPSQHFTEALNREPAPSCRPAPRILAPTLPMSGRIPDASLGVLAELHRTVGLTALEDMAKCRFRFFAGRSLRLVAAPERPAKRLDASVKGLMFHEAMEAWLEDRTRDFVVVFEQTFDDYCRKKFIPKGYELEVTRIESRRIAREIDASVQWPAVSSEPEVDCDFELPGGVKVICRVDRIDDIGDGNCIIVDYKSGKVANVEKKLESETSLQGPLYSLAVREKKQLNAVAMVFLAIREGKVIGWGHIPGSDLELEPIPPNWIEAARERTIVRLGSFLSGDVHAEPSTPEDCKWCDFKDACRVVLPAFVKVGVAGGN